MLLLLVAAAVSASIMARTFWELVQQAEHHNKIALAATTRANLESSDAQNARVQEKWAREKAERERDAKGQALTQAESLRLMALSSATLRDDPGLALLLAVQGAERAHTRQAAHNNALRTALQQCREQRTLFGPPVKFLPYRRTHVGFHFARFSPDGRRVAAAGERTHVGDTYTDWENRLALVWDAATGELRTTIRVPGQRIEAVEFSPNGKVLATLLRGWAMLRDARGHDLAMLTDRVVRLWDADTGKELCVLKGHEFRVTSVRFSPDGKRVVTTSWDRTARVWDAATGKQLHVLRDPKFSLGTAEFSPDGSRVLTLATGVQNHEPDDMKNAFPALYARHDPLFRNAPAFAQVHSWPGPFQSNGPYPDSNRDITPARLWDAVTGKQVAVLDLQPPEKAPWTTCCAFSRDGRYIATGQNNGSIHLWDALTGKHLGRWQLPPWQAKVESITFSADGRRLLMRYINGALAVVESPNDPNSRPPAEVQMTSVTQVVQLGADGRSVLWIPRPEQDASFATAGRNFRAVVHDLLLGQDTAVLVGHGDQVTAAEFSADGHRVVTASLDGTVRLWDATPRYGYATVLAGHELPVAARYSPDGRHVLTHNHEFRWRRGPSPIRSPCCGRRPRASGWPRCAGTRPSVTRPSARTCSARSATRTSAPTAASWLRWHTTTSPENSAAKNSTRG